MPAPVKNEGGVLAHKKKERVPVAAFGPQLSRILPEYMTQLNQMQSHVFPKAFHTSHNLLILAPTGAGKTSSRLSKLKREL